MTGFTKIKTSESRLSAGRWIVQHAAIIVLLALLLLNTIITKNFLQLNTIWLLISQSAGLIFPAIGMTIVISSGGIDVSAGSMMSVAAVAFTLMAVQTEMVVFSILFSVVVCTLIGVFNGYMISHWKIQPIILTLVMQMILRGASLLGTSGNAIPLNRFPEAKFLGLYRFPGGMPGQIVPIAIALVVSVFFIKKTRIGKSIESVGDNARAAHLAGIPILGTIILVYATSALLSCVGGLTEMFRTGACDPTTMGLQYETNAIAAVAIGGTSMKGGNAKIIGTVIGTFIISLIGITVNMNNIPFAFSNIVKTAIIVLAVSLQRERKA